MSAGDERTYGDYEGVGEECIHDVQQLLLSRRELYDWLETFGLTRGEAAMLTMLLSMNHRLGRIASAMEEGLSEDWEDGESPQ